MKYLLPGFEIKVPGKRRSGSSLGFGCLGTGAPLVLVADTGHALAGRGLYVPHFCAPCDPAGFHLLSLNKSPSYSFFSKDETDTLSGKIFSLKLHLPACFPGLLAKGLDALPSPTTGEQEGQRGVLPKPHSCPLVWGNSPIWIHIRPTSWCQVTHSKLNFVCGISCMFL